MSAASPCAAMRNTGPAARRTTGPWIGSAFRLGSISLDGRAAFDARTRLTQGALTLAAGNLDDLSPLALTSLGGSLNAAITLSRDGGHRMRPSGHGRRAARGSGRPVAPRCGSDRSRPAEPSHHRRTRERRPPDRGGRKPRHGSPRRRRIAERQRHHPRGQGARVRPRRRARLVPGERTRIELAALLRRARRRPAGPGRTRQRDPRRRVGPHRQPCGDGRAADASASRARRPEPRPELGIRALPLALARIASPGLAVTGTLDGEADLRGSANRPEGRYALSIARLVHPGDPQGRTTPDRSPRQRHGERRPCRIDGRVSAGRARN